LSFDRERSACAAERPQAKVLDVMSPTTARARDFASKHGIAHHFEDLDAMLANALPPWLTLKNETTKLAPNNFLQQQDKFDRLIECYNLERPHRAIGMKYPGKIYRH
jgi:transposase InsO family protein